MEDLIKHVNARREEAELSDVFEVQASAEVACCAVEFSD